LEVHASRMNEFTHIYKVDSIEPLKLFLAFPTLHQ
jgi:hypothetical protein